MAPILQIEGLTRRFGGVTAVNALSLAVNEGELVSIIGPNGAGKTTVFNLVTGLDVPDAGRVTFTGSDITGLPAEKLAPLGFARTFQHGRVFGNLSVLDNVLVGAHTRLAAVRPHLPLIGAVAELALALVRPQSVKAEEEKQAALSQLKSVEAKTAQLPSEKENILKNAKNEAAAEKKRLTAQTKADIERLKQQMQSELARLTAQTNARLRRFSAEESVRLAEEKLRGKIGKAEDAKLVKASISEIGGLN